MADFDRETAFRELVGYVRRRVAINMRVEENALPSAPLGELQSALLDGREYGFLWPLRSHIGRTMPHIWARDGVGRAENRTKRRTGGGQLKTSPNGAPILDGRGLQSVRERIQQAFQDIHKDIPLNERQFEIIEEVKPVAAAAPKPLRPLADRAEPILRVPGRRFQHVVGRKHHHPNVYVVKVPKEKVQDLFEAALRALGGKGG